VRLLLHLMSKVEPGALDYRPTPGQRSLLELLQYLVVMPPIHLRAVTAEVFDQAEWTSAWRTGEAAARELSVAQVQEAVAAQPQLFEQLLAPCTPEYLRGELELFGRKASRGAWAVSLVLCHYTAYRMQLFLYLKASGRTELNSMDLWAGPDPIAPNPVR
jgi:hypothetical protein